jgi:hypothetical protein
VWAGGWKFQWQHGATKRWVKTGGGHCESLFLARQPPTGPGPPHSQGFYITHNDAPQSVGLIWASYQLVAETSTCQHTTITTERHLSPRGIRTHNLTRRAAAHLRHKRRSHWDQRHSESAEDKGKLTGLRCLYSSPSIGR